MKKIRIISRLDVKNEYLVKGIQLEGLRKLGTPGEFAKKYYDDGVDEIIYMDVVASLYNRDSIIDIVKKTSENIFVPLTVGGGIRSIDDISKLLSAGADKVAINTAAVKNPGFITEAAKTFGSQCIVGSIESKKNESGYEAYIDNGREKTGLDVIEWGYKLESLGAGEILLTSVDKDGTKKGFDIGLVKQFIDKVKIPVIISGGAGFLDDFKALFELGQLDAVAVGSILHYNRANISGIKAYLSQMNLPVRLSYE